jgi:hypothetical protein
MIKRLLSKCFFTLGLLLIFTLLLPLTPYGGKTAYAGNIDKEKNVDYRLNVKSKIMVKGKTFTLRTYNLSEGAKVSFKSEDSDIASVSDDGTITANRVGVTVITATIKDGNNTNSLYCDVTVGPPAFSVKITKSRIILGVDKVDFLSVILKPSNTTEEVGLYSDNKAVATISPAGRVSAKKIGFTYLVAMIDALNFNGKPKYEYCTIIVTNPEDAPLTETYFSEHPELDLIPVIDFEAALGEFFNRSTEETPSANPILSSKDYSVKALDQFLNDKFNLADLRKQREEAIAKATQTQTEVSSDNATK